jgi:hypothetical protein
MEKFKRLVAKYLTTAMSKPLRKLGIDEKEYEKLSLGEKWKYLCDKRKEIDRHVRKLITQKEKE